MINVTVSMLKLKELLKWLVSQPSLELITQFYRLANLRRLKQYNNMCSQLEWNIKFSGYRWNEYEGSIKL